MLVIIYFSPICFASKILLPSFKRRPCDENTEVTPWLIKTPRPFLDTADDNKNTNRFIEYGFVEV